MKILVFGKAGQVARELQRQADVTAWSREDCNLSDPKACAAALAKSNADVVINAAAYTAVDKAEQEEALATTINGNAPTAMAQAAAAKDIPFLHISTDYVFNGSGNAPWRPDDATAPLGAYGRSKLVGEIGVAQAGGTHAILRTSWVFSAHGANFVKTMLRLGDAHEQLTVVADQIGGPTSAGAIADALLRMAQAFHSGNGQSGIYHFSGTPDVSWADFAREIFAQTGQNCVVKGIPSIDYPTPAARPANSRMDCRSTKAVFGIKQPNWRADLSMILNELKKES